jgi:hypothetical protein
VSALPVTALDLPQPQIHLAPSSSQFSSPLPTPDYANELDLPAPYDFEDGWNSDERTDSVKDETEISRYTCAVLLMSGSDSIGRPRQCRCDGEKDNVKSCIEVQCFGGSIYCVDLTVAQTRLGFQPDQIGDNEGSKELR